MGYVSYEAGAAFDPAFEVHEARVPLAWPETHPGDEAHVQWHEGLTRPETALADVFAALFPCGSITGAPKVSAMQMIRRIEPGPRGVYCGAVGVVRPVGVATFYVAIRTVTVQDGSAHCGIGSGITADATAQGEWPEWHHKRSFLERASAPFELLETLALEDSALRHTQQHLARLARAAPVMRLARWRWPRPGPA